MATGIVQTAQEVERYGREVRDYALSLGADLYGVASAAAYAERFPAKPRPEKFFAGAQSVVVVGLAFTGGAYDTVARPELAGLRQKATEGVTNRGRVRGVERYFTGEENNTLNHQVSLLAYQLAKKLERDGHAALWLPPNKQDERYRTAPFYHMPAMYLAGLGTLGLNASILTPEYGPRVWVTSIVTTAPLPAGQPLAKELCDRCGDCVKACPVQALDGSGWKDPFRCAAYGCCGTCLAVCPVGKCGR